MLKLAALHSLQYKNLDSYFSEISKTPKQISQLHALSLKTAALNHPSVSSRLLALYADPKINNLHNVQSLFDHTQQPTLFSWNTILKCYIENHRSHDALLLFEEMLSVSPFMPDHFTFPTLIKGCARLGAVEEGKQIHGLILKTGFGLDMFVQSSLVNLYSKCRDIGYARKVFDKMTQKDIISWNSLMDGYVKCGKLELAEELFDQMPERDAFSWTVLVDGLSKCGKVKDAREVFDRMPIRNLASWNAMITGYMKSGNVNAARHLFDQMERRDLITWNSMIAGFESNGKYVEAMVLFQKMLNEYFIPNQVTLVSILSVISGLPAISKGKWVHSYLAKSGYNWEGVLGTSLIEMYCKCGSIESALAVFHTIQKKKLGHWTALVVGLGMHGLANKAIEIFNQMLTVGVKPNDITFIGVLNACSHAGLVSEGRRYFDMMVKEYGVEPSVEHYGCLVDILCRAGQLKEAKELIEQMPIEPNKVIWMSLLSGAKSHKNVEIGEYAAQRVIEVAPQTIGCYVLLSNIYAAAGQWKKVSQVREMMRNRGVKKDPGCSTIEHKGVVHEFVVGDKSHYQTKEIYSKLEEMRSKLKCSGHVADTTQVLLCIDGQKEKEAELENHSERLAIAFGLINVGSGIPIRIFKNLRVCSDCHSVTKLLSKIYGREIIVRDNSRFHHFINGSCSCMDYW